MRGYVVEAHVARGGMGDVHRARVEATGELVAIKVMRVLGDGESAAAAHERFAREARVLASLAHPGIVRYVAHGSTLDGRPYIATEWLEGETLAARLATSRSSAREAARLGAAIADALATAHEAGIVHRDVKPSNVIVTPDGAPRLVDFGVAKIAAPALTHDGALVGTEAYMAPEQLWGSADVGAAADVFALGCVLFRALTGHLPWGDQDPSERLARMLAGDVPNLRAQRPDVPDDLASTIACMLHTDAATRPSARKSAATLARLATVIEEEESPASHEDAVSKEEQALVAVLVVAAAGPGDVTRVGLEEASAEARARAEVERLREVFEGAGGRAELGATAHWVVVFGGGGAGSSEIAEHVSSAARAAIEARTLVARPIAIATGRAEITGRAAIGDAVSRALALVRDAESDGIMLDEASASLLASRFVVEAGPRAPQLFEERREGAATPTVCGRVVPFFGRDTELALLAGDCQGAFVTSRPGIALVIGPAGAGKSRLAAEVAAAVAAGTPGVVVVTTPSDPLGAGAPFGAAARIVRAVERARGSARWDDEGLAPFIAQLAGRGAAFADDERLRAARVQPALMRDRLRDAFRAVLGRVEGALLVVVDDLQWVDTASLRLLEDVLGRGTRLFLLALARPEIRDAMPSLPSSARIIELPPLDGAAGNAFARAVLGEDARASVVERIVRLGDGNAFFLEELARAAATHGSTPLPDSVVALTQARLGALPPFARRVLRAASIVRPRITEDAVAHLLGRATRQDEVGRTLEDLVAREVLVRRELSFDFRHELLAEAAYASLTETDARRGHLAAASFADTAWGRDPRRVAEHLERGGDDARAAEAYARAAELTLHSGDFEGAIACADRAEACGVTGEAKGRVLAVRSAVERWHGDVARAVELGTRALDMLDPQDATFSEAAADVAAAAGAAGDEAALARIAARLLAGPAEADAWRIRALASAALSLVRVGRPAEADIVLARAESMRAALVKDQAIADIGLDNARAARLTYAGDPMAYLRIMPGVLERASRLGDARTACLARAHLGYGHAAVGAWADAEATLLDARAEAERLELPSGRASVLHNLARVLEANGRVEDARALQEQALVAALEQRNMRLATACRLYLAHNRRTARDLDKAREHALLAHEGAREQPLRAWAAAILAEILVDLGEADAALGHARDAHAFFTTSGGIGEGDATVQLAYARALYAAGEGPAAREALVAARDRLLARAGSIGDPARVHSFLTCVEVNAATLARCRQEGIDVDP